jgi:protocatechuate 4,5-dioxygenase beta chain
MATVLGGITTSHIPAIGGAIAKQKFQEPYWKSFFDAYGKVHSWLDAVKPDVAVVVYNDHGLNFFLDKMPTFSIGAASQYRNADEGWGLSTVPPFAGNPELSWYIIEELVGAEFDITMCQDMVVDHGFVIPMQLLWTQRLKGACPVTIVPVCVNTVQHPLPSPARCLKLGRAIGEAIASYPENLKVVVLGTGGLSHQLDGERAGFINKDFDLWCMEKIVSNPDAIAEHSIRDLVRLSGAQGVELINWLIMRGTLGEHVEKRHQNYHIPISNTASGLMLLEAA